MSNRNLRNLRSGEGAAMVRASVDKQSCQSSGRCVRAAPGAFALDADHLAEARAGAAALAEDELLAIARACPALAIHVFDELGEEREL
jgi:ferredoxin